MKVFKDPAARLDHHVDWSKWLEGDTLTSSTWDVPDGLTGDGQTHDETKATIWLAGGALGQSYKVVNRITTAAGRIDERSLRIEVRDR